MRAVKGNKEYTIEEADQKGYQDMGFDILGEDGETIAYGRGKTVPYGDYVAAVREIERLQEMAAELSAENEALRVRLEVEKAGSGEKKGKADATKAGE